MSPSDDIDDDVQRFLRERVDSIELLEVLLALRADRARAVAVDAIERALGSSARSIEARLATLTALGLAERGDDGWRYRPADAALDDLMARVERCYRERRLSVINLIYAPKPDDLRLFSDAFRLRPPRKEDQR